MALILKQPDRDSIILRRSLAARLSGLIWLAGAGGIMFMFNGDNRIWIVLPCLLIGIHLLTYSPRIRIRLPERDILWQRRILLLFAQERLLPFAGIRSVRIGAHGRFFKMWRLYFFLVDASRLSITHSYLLDRIEAQGDELVWAIGKPLVYEEGNRTR